MSLRFLTAGESHGPALIAILEGLPAGLPISTQIIDRELARRQRGYGAGPRMKIERDKVNILGGVLAGETTGAPLALQIENRDHEKWFNQEIDPLVTPRPGHADLTGTIKYGYRDLRPALERASARETAARVAVGAACKQFLAQFDIQVGGYVTAIGEVTADLEGIPLEKRSTLAEESEVRCPEPQAAERMEAAIQEIMQARDTLGGILEVVALGLPPGLGSHVHWDRRLEARLGAAVLSIQAMKGVEIGPAFEVFAEYRIHLVSQAANLLRHRGREEQGLSLFGQRLDDLLADEDLEPALDRDAVPRSNGGQRGACERLAQDRRILHELALGRFERVEPRADNSFTTHSVSPQALLAMGRDCFGAEVEGYSLGIRGYDFDDLGEGLSRRARANLAAALAEREPPPAVGVEQLGAAACPIQRLVGELGDEVRLPVVLHPLGDHSVEGALQGRERYDIDLLCLDLSRVA